MDTCGTDLAQEQAFDLPGLGPCFLPHEFAVHTGQLVNVEVRSALEPPRDVLALVASGTAVVLTGPYAHVDGIFRYFQHNEKTLAADAECSHIENRRQRSAAFAALRRQRFHRLLVQARGDAIVGCTGCPDTAGLQQWLTRPTGDRLFLLPVRRLQRILTDMRRAKDGIAIDGLSVPITILPGVYVPSDKSVPGMLSAFASNLHGKRVLDMGTGTGVLALLAAKLGAKEVVATDSNPRAVENARTNVELAELGGIVKVAGPAHLFDAVPSEVFDVIIFNAPWIQGEPKTLYDAAIYDSGYRVIDGFMREAPLHLAAGGSILLQYSNVSEGRGDDSMRHLNETVAANGLRVEESSSISRLSRVTGTREHVFVFRIRRG